MSSSGDFLEGADWRLFCPQCSQEAIVYTDLVPRMLRNAISAFTRVFDALCPCGVVSC
jgi:hypothetical protein